MSRKQRVYGLITAIGAATVVLTTPGVSTAAGQPGSCPTQAGYREEAANNALRVALDRNGDGIVCVKDLNPNVFFPRNLIDNNVQAG